MKTFVAAPTFLLLTACGASQVTAGTAGNSNIQSDVIRSAYEAPESKESTTGEAPLLTILGEQSVSVEVGSAYDDLGVLEAIGSDGEDLYSSVTVDTSELNTEEPGSYRVLYSVTDSQGETTTVGRDVTVVTQPESAPLVGSAVTARLNVLTRKVGVAPETMYFSAMKSTSFNETDYLGGTDAEAIAVSKLTYHFNFDDTDSGYFNTTGKSRNSQVSGAPRAIHTFDCKGATDPNWVWNYFGDEAGDGACVFNVQVRVQDTFGEYDTAAVEVAIKTQEDAYAPEKTYCISATSNWEGCPAGAIHANDSLLPGEYSGNRVLYQRGSEVTYSNIGISHGEKNVTIDTYGVGSRPVVGNIYVGSELVNDTTAATFDTFVAEDAPNGDRTVRSGWAYDITVTGLRVGILTGGQAVTLMTAHDLDMDWSETPNEDGFGRIYFASNANWCGKTDKLDCANVHYPYGSFITDSVIKGYTGSLPLINIGCFNSCMIVNSGMAGNEVNISDEHNSRVMGSWGLVVSNNWFRGNHLGGSGAKAKLTLRVPGSDRTAYQLSTTANPENFAANGHIRTEERSEQFISSYAMVVDNKINDPEQDPNSVSGSFVGLDKYHRYSGVYNNEFLADAVTAESGKFTVLGMNGMHLYAVNNSIPSVYAPCSRSSTEVDGYHDTATIQAISTDWSEFNAPKGSQCSRLEAPMVVPAAP
ncbi:DUF5011 domain-containing protein [Teredinibacter turnerae]|uniref:DUF5011 domain-containing protein n=1 Tax=Teredinibacter turnerae TaxID=2426 RepID=UPI0030D26B1A